ncbi:hypothetical protein BUALT_Bualt08G0119200 [Buddleja alternifolia]|uniref:Uncharacterized protein n=1 Tax=Buddleja alternifolia TaxID=168488 RepID=A0AAV6X626_9LAMI|nr:hypothetical protein BUALT_Bualt08G0119200 [Buddleja alternifolia]
MIQEVAELEKKLEKIEEEKIELVNALDESENSLKATQSKICEGENKLEELQKELRAAKEKELLEFQLVAELTVECRELGIELTRTLHETELQQNINSIGELKLKQKDLAVAADKRTECQKTIASLGRQLSSLATLEDFLIDTSNIPGFYRVHSSWALMKNAIWTLQEYQMKKGTTRNHRHSQHHQPTIQLLPRVGMVLGNSFREVRV